MNLIGMMDDHHNHPGAFHGFLIPLVGRDAVEPRSGT
jgi:hypothetical protein